MMRKENGFTIIELMITLAVAAVVMGVAAPSLGGFVKNSALRNQVYDMLSSITTARSEALKNGSRVVMCRSANPLAATPSCGGTTDNWSTGWLLFISQDSNTVYNAGTDVLVKVGMPAPSQINVLSNGTGNNYLVFNPDGTLDETGAAQSAVCDDRGTGHGRLITVGLVGRPNLTTGTPSSALATCDPA